MAQQRRQNVADIYRVAREKFGYDHLRPGQEEAILALLQGHDVLAVMPTGSGKSAIYQIASLLLPGPTVIISPLIALQRDQVESIERRQLGEASEVNSTVRASQRQEAFEELVEDEIEFLFIAPEQFNHAATLQQIRRAHPSLFVVDEAHAISEWGHDFRPEYLRLGAVVEELGHPRVLALTATASPHVREEIIDRLHLHEPQVVVRGFNRPNIWLGVEKFHDERPKHQALLERIANAEKPGIVYAATHKHAEELGQELNEQGIAAVVYHGGMPAREREAAQEAFMQDEAEIIVATSAFGMGIDKPNVRFVFHYDISDSLDSYYQEIGRAGRDGKPARAILFYRQQDVALRHFFAGSGKVDVEQVEQVAEAVEEHRGPVEMGELEEETGLSASKLVSALTNLEDVGAVEITATGDVRESGHPDVHEVAAEAVEAEERHRLFERSRVEMMRGYAEVYDCRREYLLNYFGEVFDAPCNYCDNDQAGHVSPKDESEEPFPLNSKVVHAVWGEGMVERYEGDAVVVLFDSVGYKKLALDFVVETGALQRAGRAAGPAVIEESSGKGDTQWPT